MNIQQIKKDGYSFFNRQAPENRLKNITTVQYIEDVASKSGVNISLWNLKEMFEDQEKRTKESFHLLTDKKLINKIFFERREELAADKTKEIEMIDKSIADEVNKVTAVQMKNQVERLREEIKSRERNVAAHFSQANQYLEAASRHRVDLENLESRKSPIPFEISQVLQNGFWKFLELIGEQITFVTTEDIVLTHVNKSAGLDMRVNVGKYKCMLNLRTMSLRVYTYQNNVQVGEIYHPYIGPTGDPCWGSASDSAAKFMSQAKVSDVMQLLATLLSTYTDSNPYRRLTDFAKKRPEDARQTESGQGGIAAIVDESFPETEDEDDDEDEDGEQNAGDIF